MTGSGGSNRHFCTVVFCSMGLRLQFGSHASKWRHRVECCVSAARRNATAVRISDSSLLSKICDIQNVPFIVLKIQVFRNVTLCRCVRSYRRFERSLWWWYYDCPRQQNSSTSDTAVRTSRPVPFIFVFISSACLGGMFWERSSWFIRLRQSIPSKGKGKGKRHLRKEHERPG
jgi:hypothetical protein